MWKWFCSLFPVDAGCGVCFHWEVWTFSPLHSEVISHGFVSETSSCNTIFTRLQTPVRQAAPDGPGTLCGSLCALHHSILWLCLGQSCEILKSCHNKRPHCLVAVWGVWMHETQVKQCSSLVCCRVINHASSQCRIFVFSTQTSVDSSRGWPLSRRAVGALISVSYLIRVKEISEIWSKKWSNWEHFLSTMAQKLMSAFHAWTILISHTHFLNYCTFFVCSCSKKPLNPKTF